ncbi:glycosyltransferase family 4 protein [Planktotalea arctica]|uniref:glycosyltransferase family 4 protein n=1 Tax=Planktotalea arctica TaxID=1481893 RepID=UPI000A176D64|nr:glycosyltransferase family 4 protein [Planktotalea arctica]
MTDRSLKIAYLCDITPLDANLYSGGNARMYHALRRHAGEVTILSNSWHLVEPLRRLVHRLPEAINLRLRWRLHLVLGRLIARDLRRELARGDFDVLFCAYSIQSLAGLGATPNMVTAFTTDATPTTYKRSLVGQSFGSMLSISRYFDPWVAAQERRILAETDLLLLPSDWLKEGIEESFALPGDAHHVVPWGANIGEVAALDKIAPLRADAVIELLFMGRDWHAKGGPIARDVLDALIARGHKARLTILGCYPDGMQESDTIRIIPQLDKSKPEEMARFAALFRSAHFLINPSFESYGFAYCEASAYGLPSLSFRVGGVPVRDGINGHALPLGTDGDGFAAVISEYIANPSAHKALRKSSRREYEERLNWDAWGRRVSQILRDAVRSKG